MAIIAAFAAALFFDVGWVFAGLIPAAAIVISLGLIERYVRRRALQRQLPGEDETE